MTYSGVGWLALRLAVACSNCAKRSRAWSSFRRIEVHEYGRKNRLINASNLRCSTRSEARAAQKATRWAYCEGLDVTLQSVPRRLGSCAPDGVGHSPAEAEGEEERAHGLEIQDHDVRFEVAVELRVARPAVDGACRDERQGCVTCGERARVSVRNQDQWNRNQDSGSKGAGRQRVSALCKMKPTVEEPAARSLGREPRAVQPLFLCPVRFPVNDDEEDDRHKDEGQESHRDGCHGEHISVEVAVAHCTDRLRVHPVDPDTQLRLRGVAGIRVAHCLQRVIVGPSVSAVHGVCHVLVELLVGSVA
eukprot:3747842-Rhodomonas_salina.1